MTDPAHKSGRIAPAATEVDSSEDGVLFAAVDLGSNSFHLVVARQRHGELQTLCRKKARVSLASGLLDGGVLTQNAIARGLHCLAGFAQQLQAVPPQRRSVVGTSALRQAENRVEFITQAEALLGTSIRIVTGEEEASLIFAGVAHSLEDSTETRVVFDIGGGSTELVTGSGFEVHTRVSVPLGCVTLSDKYFKGGRYAGVTAGSVAEPDAVPRLGLGSTRDIAGFGHLGGSLRGHLGQSFEAAYAYACASLQAVRDRESGLEALAQVRAVGTSGTIESVLEVLRAHGETSDMITADGVQHVRDLLLARSHVLDFGLSGLQPDRADIFPAGFAIVCALFEVFGLERMEYVDASLKDGLLYQNLPSPVARDVRSRSIRAWQRRFDVDVPHAQRVEGTAMAFFVALAQPWSLAEQEGPRRLLAMACALHELGLAISPAQFERHGAYLIANGELRGFTRHTKQQLAFLVRAHRQAIPQMSLLGFTESERTLLFRLALILRWSVILNRSRTADVPASISCQVRGEDRLEIALPQDWLHAHPLTSEELQQEAERLTGHGMVLVIAGAA